MANSNTSEKVSLSAEIVAAYVTHNSVTPSGLPALIESVHASLTSLGAVEAVPKTEALVPAVSVRKSISPDYLICLDDGKKFKSLKRHLGRLISAHGSRIEANCAYFARMNSQNADPRFGTGWWKLDLTVNAPRSQQCRVKNIYSALRN